MLYRTFHNNNLTAYILAPLILLLYWIRVFLVEGVQPISFDGLSMPLWEWFVRPVFGQSAFWAAAFSFILALMIAFTVNRIVGRYSLLSRQSLLPALLYGLLVSGFLSVQRLHVVWVFALFFLLGIERIWGAPNSSQKEARCFDASLLVGFGALMYAKGLYLYPILWVIMSVLRLLTVRTFLAGLMGLLLPFVLSAGYFYFFGKTQEFFLFVVLNLLSNTGQFSHNIASQIYLPLLVALTLIGMVNVVRYMPTQKIITRKYLRVIIWLILLSSAACLTPYFSVEITPLLAIGPTVVLAFWLDKIKSGFWQETFAWFLVCITVGAQFFL
jgi:hypothetical protein